MRSLRIAHVSATFPPYRGGTGNVCAQNAYQLAERGHCVTVFSAAMAGQPAYEQRDGITIRRLRPLVRLGNAPLLPGLVTALRGFDLIHLHYPFIGGEGAALAALLAHTPLLITYHQDVLLHGALGLVEQALRHSVGRAALRSAQRVLFTSADYGQHSHSSELLRGCAERVGELPNGVDTQRFSPQTSPSGLRARYGIDLSEQVILLVAGLDRAHYFKGVHVLLAALARLGPTLRGLIVGDGDLRAAYMREAQRLGLGQRVIFTGRVDDAALPGYYQAADLTVLPSTTMGEAFGLVLLESLACATPVIASDLPGVRTVVASGRDGLLVPPGDAAALGSAIGDLLADDGRRQLMGRHGRERVVHQYDWAVIGARLEAIYYDLLGEELASHKIAAL